MFVSLYKIKAEDQNAYDEFMLNPFGPHSPNLQRILNLFRGCGQERYALLCLIPHKEWMLIKFSSPGSRVEMFEDYIFNNLADAEREIFRRRWQFHTKKV